MGHHPFRNDESSHDEATTQTEQRRVDLVNLDGFRYDTCLSKRVKPHR
jgi:hypothetical protein